MLTWDDVHIVIRAVDGKRAHCLASLLCHPLFHSGTKWSISYHGVGRSVPESYCDALALGSDRPYVLQLEDDTILRSDFQTQAMRLLNEHSQLPLLSFYSGRKVKPNEELNQRHPSVEMKLGICFSGALAFFFHSHNIADHNAFVLRYCKDKPYHTDTATGEWLKANRYKYGRSWPSIVQHGGTVSLSGHFNHPNRYASSYVDQV